MRVINFYSVSESYGCFSNFSDHPVFLLGTRWRTAEHCFQAQKFTDDRIMHRIQMARTPLEAANIGRNRSNPIREDWESIKVEVMRNIVHAKFAQNSEIRTVLLSTDDALIVEHTRNDDFWGDGEDGTGKNMLGKILMDVRKRLLLHSSDLKNEMLPPWEKFPLLNKSDIDWEMGSASSYMSDWVLFWLQLNDTEKRGYIEKYPEPAEWKRFYDID